LVSTAKDIGVKTRYFQQLGVKIKDVFSCNAMGCTDGLSLDFTPILYDSSNHCCV